MSRPVCRGYQCISADLINAHIVPRGFARDIKGDYPHNFKISLDKAHPTQHGVYDANILCESCDGKLGKLDNYALGVCRRFPREHVDTRDGGWEMANVHGDQFATFVLSMLWRASITSRVEFRKVSLGLYEDPVCKVIFGITPLSNLAAYQLLLARYEARPNFNPERNYTSPAPLTMEGANGWAFALHGFRVIAKLNRRPLPPGFELIVVNGNTKLNGPYVNYDSTPEGRAMVEMKKADLAGWPGASLRDVPDDGPG
jgi:hypothetical protein